VWVRGPDPRTLQNLALAVTAYRTSWSREWIGVFRPWPLDLRINPEKYQTLKRQPSFAPVNKEKTN
jgi:hypothetical protein